MPTFLHSKVPFSRTLSDSTFKQVSSLTYPKKTKQWKYTLSTHGLEVQTKYDAIKTEYIKNDTKEHHFFVTPIFFAIIFMYSSLKPLHTGSRYPFSKFKILFEPIASAGLTALMYMASLIFLRFQFLHYPDKQNLPNWFCVLCFLLSVHIIH